MSDVAVSRGRRPEAFARRLLTRRIGSVSRACPEWCRFATPAASNTTASELPTRSMCNLTAHICCDDARAGMIVQAPRGRPRTAVAVLVVGEDRGGDIHVDAGDDARSGPNELRCRCRWR